MDQYIGKMLDNRYEILERIGTGGMAVVYKAKCHRLNRLVAIKILKADLAQDADFRRRFNAESQAVAQLSHPNIVSVYDVSKGGDLEYIVMELIDGITLKQYMEKRGQLNWRESLHFITQIMRGLSHAHSRGIVHRDIKPQNIMVLRDGSVKVADFGIACLENSAQTLTQEALGSVHYISPEQARGDRTDARSDIYSAGVVLYEMLTGRLPFEGDSAVSVAIQHLSSIPLAPREINPDIPEQLELICMKAMSPALDKRYASADAMIADLETFRKNPEVNLDFEMQDLRPEVIDEPTRPLRTPADHPTAPHRQPPREREYRRDYDEYDEPAPQKKTGQTVLIVIAVVLAAALAFVLIRSILGSFETPVEEYMVQNVVGYTVEQAQEMNGVKDIFEIKVAGEEFSEYDPGVIVRQDPAAEAYRRGDGLVINVWVSAGEEVGEMIDVTNKTVPEAKILLKSLIDQYDLEVVAQEEDMRYSDKVNATYIISSTPAAKEPLKKGDIIYLVVSKGPEVLPVAVPNFMGRQMEEVRKELTTWKLTCTDADIELVDSDRPGGEIVWQSLDPETTAQEWDTIQFQVSSGLAATTKPLNVELPQDGRETVTVTVYVGSETSPQYNEPVNCSDIYAYVTLTGTGSQQVKVYIDGVLDQYQSQTMDFSE
jgi:serine/threonine-protein kinase